MLGVLINGLSPYNVQFCARIGREVPQIQLRTVFTTAGSNWDIEIPTEANAVKFGHAQSERQEKWATFRLADLRRAGRIFAHFQANHVKAVIHCGYLSLLHLRLIALCRKHHMKVFLRGDSNIKGDLPRSWAHAWLKRRLLGWAIRQCHGVMPMGEYGRQFFHKYGADLNQSYLVPFEPAYELFTDVDQGEVEGFRQRHHLPTGRRYLLYCGRLVPVKRVDLLIAAFAAISERRPQWDLVIVGDGVLRQDLQTGVPGSLQDRIKWLGFCEVEEARLAYHVADVLVLPSDYEPWAVVINEAAAVGLVVVASDVVGAARELVRDRVSGRIFEAGNCESLIEALLDVTDEQTHASYRSQVASLLAQWREKADPVEGVRQALRSIGMLAPKGLN